MSSNVPFAPLPMRPRQGILELFSTFLEFDHDRFRSWTTDSRLRRSMGRCLAQASQQESDRFWALYWHKIWQQSPKVDQPTNAPSLTTLARGHLTAYVQEPCYWAAQKTAENFSSTQYGLADCFQMAIAQIDKVLKGFDAQQGFSLKNYASAVLNSLIRESLRQRQEIDICTDWGLLRKVSQKRLVEALQNVGLAPDTIASYVLAWSCFRSLYVPKQATGTQKLAKPDRDTWMAIAQLYNSERIQFPGSTAASVEALEKWMSNCAKATRSYLHPSIISINTPKPGQEEGEFLDDLSEMAQTSSLLNDLIAEEEAQTRQTQRIQLGEALTAAIAQLDSPSQRLIQLYYCGQFTQQQIAEQLEMKQYTVSRRLTRAREALLSALAKWSQDVLHITPTSDVLRFTSAALEEWLKTHYSQPDPSY